ncbi:MAG TPA: hypothetical protein PLQ36_01870 [Candidatus Gracilibacteria bacterium]|nr:hypothetical protein [Candidatus Gracilibacteria bacterium]
MHYKQIIQEAWDITTEEKSKLFAYGFIPSFFGVIVGMFYIGYQINAFRISPLFNHEVKSHHGFDSLAFIKPILDLISEYPFWTIGLILVGIGVFLMYTFSPIICKSALIDLIYKKIQGQELKGGFTRGLETFFPVLEFSAIVSTFSLTAYLTEVSMIIRNFNQDSWIIIIPFLSICWMVGMMLSFLFIFGEQLIVIEKLSIIQAIKRSSILVLSHMKDTLFLALGVTLISIRIILNIIIVLLIPLIFMGIMTLLTAMLSKLVAIIIASILSIATIIGSAYLMTGFHIFIYAIWTLSFVNFQKD